MRVPLIAELATRDGSASKDSQFTNVLKENVGGTPIAVIRPGLKSVYYSNQGNGRGLVSFNDELLSIFGANLVPVNPLGFIGPTGNNEGYSMSFRVMSGDGGTSAGTMYNPYSGVTSPWIWSSTMGLTPLDNAGYEQCTITAISNDGSVVAGSVTPFAGSQTPCVWVNGTLITLTTTGGPAGEALGVSYDGTMICGWVQNPGATKILACRWDANNTYAAGFMSHSTTTYPNAKINATGSTTDVCVGYVENVSGTAFPARWDAGVLTVLPLTGLNAIGGTVQYMTADAVVLAGTHVIDNAPAGVINGAWRWTAGDGYQTMFAKANTDVYITSMSVDGMYFAGYVNDYSDPTTGHASTWFGTTRTVWDNTYTEVYSVTSKLKHMLVQHGNNYEILADYGKQELTVTTDYYDFAQSTL